MRLTNLTNERTSCVFTIAFAKIKWEEERQVRTQTRVTTESIGTYKDLQIRRRTIRERFADGRDWKQPTSTYTINGCFYDTSYKVGMYIAEYDEKEREEKRKLRYK